MTTGPTSPTPDDPRPWGLLSKHARVLALVAQHPEARVRDLARWMGTTERTTQVVLGELADAGVLLRTRVGRRNRYRVASPGRAEVRLALNGDLHAMRRIVDALDASGRAEHGRPDSLGA